VEKIRPDVVIHNDTGNIFDGIYGSDFSSLSAIAQERRRQAVLNGLVASGRHVYFTVGSSISRLPGLKSVPAGLLNMNNEPQKNFNPWAGYRLRGVNDESIYKDYWMRELTAKYHYGLAGYYWESGKKEKARMELMKAGETATDIEVIQNNIADRLTAYGYLDDGLAAFRRAMAINPDNPYIYFNTALVLSGAKRYNEAMDNLRQAVKLKPDFADAYNSMAICYYYTGHIADAVAALDRALVIDPVHPQAAQNRRMILDAQKREGKR
jgi:tetratricopeptide (TPR) repeat protein